MLSKLKRHHCETRRNPVQFCHDVLQAPRQCLDDGSSASSDLFVFEARLGTCIQRGFKDVRSITKGYLFRSRQLASVETRSDLGDGSALLVHSAACPDGEILKFRNRTCELTNERHYETVRRISLLTEHRQNGCCALPVAGSTARSRNSIGLHHEGTSTTISCRYYNCSTLRLSPTISDYLRDMLIFPCKAARVRDLDAGSARHDAASGRS